MGIDCFATIARWSGGVLALITFGAIYYGIYRGLSRPTGRIVGRDSGFLHSTVFYLITSFIFFGICLLLWRPLPLALTPMGQAAMLIAGILLYFPGMGLTLWGRLELGRMYFVSTASGAELFSGHRLVTSGPYAIVRHPMYFGLSVAVLGGLLLYQTWTMVVLLLLPFGLARRARREEQALAAEFGEDWRVYCQAVPALFPRLTKKKPLVAR